MSSPHPINQSRAQLAREVVEAYGSISGDGFCEEAIGDLLSDIGHLCDKEQLDYVAILRKAVAYWKIEQTHPDELANRPEVEIIIEDREGWS